MEYYKIFGKEKIYIEDFNNKCKICGNEFKTVNRNKEIEIIKCKTNNCSKRKLENTLKQLFNEKKTGELLDKFNFSYKGRYSEQWFINKHGNEEGIKKRQHWIDTCKTGKETLILRHGETEGLKRFEQFKERSKHTKEKYILQHGVSEGSKLWDKYILKKKKTSKRSILYWIKQTNGDYIEAEKLLFNHQSTSTLNKFIKKYGKEKGLIKYNEVNKSKTRNWENGYRFSKISLKLFDELSNRLKYKPLYGKGNEYRLCNKYNVDFYIKELNLCIEFNGDFWHANPKIYNKFDVNPVNNNIAEDIWNKDKIRIEEIEKETNILIIWEYETRKHFDDTILKCINYIKGIESERGNHK